MKQLPKNPLLCWGGICYLISWLALVPSAVTATIECDHTPCGNNRIQICHFNGKEFQTLCIRQNSVLRRPNNHHSSVEDYCGPCTSGKAFETREELQQAVAQYVDENHYDVELATTYGWPMNSWDVSLITDFSELFARSSINEDLSDWDTSAATNMAMMFWHCDKFESGGIWRWDVSKVKTMERMFFGASKFNGDLSDWITTKVTSLMGTFWRATKFNQDIGYWDTSRVTDASRLFAEATTFDQDLRGWNTTQMRDLSYMFLQATSFQQDLSHWDLSNAITLERMLYKVPAYEFSVNRQDALLTSWKRQWANAGRVADTVNTEDMFSCETKEEAQAQAEEATVLATSSTSYMRGKNTHILHLKSTSSFQAAQQHNQTLQAAAATTDEQGEMDSQPYPTTATNQTELPTCAPGMCNKQ